MYGCGLGRIFMLAVFLWRSMINMLVEWLTFFLALASGSRECCYLPSALTPGPTSWCYRMPLPDRRDGSTVLLCFWRVFFFFLLRLSPLGLGSVATSLQLWLPVPPLGVTGCLCRIGGRDCLMWLKLSCVMLFKEWLLKIRLAVVQLIFYFCEDVV